MRRPSTTIVLLTLSLTTVATVAALARAGQPAPLSLVSTAWTPFTNQAGQPRFALDLVEAALSRIGLSAKTTIVAPAQFTPALLSDQFDGTAAAWKDAEREKMLVFSEPYLENRLILVARHGDDVSAGALSELKGKRIAIVEGYSYGDTLDGSGATFVRSQSEEDSLTLLLSSKADYALMDELVVQFIVNNYPTEAKTRLSLGTKPLLTRQLYFAVRRSRPDAQSIVNRFNAQLRGMIADRTYHRLLHVSWIFADVDGDGLPEFVPQNDQAGTSAPQHAYTLFTVPPPTGPQLPAKPSETQPRFYLGGSIYTDWASVPNRYKIENPNRPDPSRSTASIFRFSW